MERSRTYESQVNRIEFAQIALTMLRLQFRTLVVLNYNSDEDAISYVEIVNENEVEFHLSYKVNERGIFGMNIYVFLINP